MPGEARGARGRAMCGKESGTLQTTAVLVVMIVVTVLGGLACGDLADDDVGMWHSLLVDSVQGDEPQPLTEDANDNLWEALTSGRADGGEDTVDGVSSPSSEGVVDTASSPSSEGINPGWTAVSSTPSAAAAGDILEGGRQDEGLRPDGVSLAFVFDSTGSMHRDLEQLKRGAALILAAMLARPDRPISDYVFVPFNDPEVGPATKTTNPDNFRAQLEAVEVHGGLDCPEPALQALLEALDQVRPNSFIYVFTDASAKDPSRLSEVLSQVQKKQTQVVFVMTGDCKDSNTTRYQSLENIAAASSGQIYHINKTEVENVLSFVRQTLDSRKVNLVSVDLPEASKKEHAVEIDESIQEFTVSVSGENPQISVVDPSGVVIDRPPALQSILDLDNVKVVAVKQPSQGSWTVETSSDSKHAVRLTALSVVDFSYGFSAEITDRLDETYHRPLLGASNYIMVGGTDMGSVWNLTSVDLLAINGSTLQTILLSPLNALDGLYRGGPFVPPEEEVLFYLANSGYGTDGFPIKRITPTAISAEPGGLPSVKLQSEKKVWLEGSLNLRCHIDSLLPFTAWFSKNGVPLLKKKKYQQTALMTFKIDGITEEMGGEYVCYARNVIGFGKDSMDVAVTGPPPEVITETQLQVQPGHAVVLDCFIRSKLRYNMTWVKVLSQSPNFSEPIGNNTHFNILQNSSLVINPVLSEDTGLFACVAENQGGRRESRIQLVVNDPLQIIVHPKSFAFENGHSFSLICESHGSLPSKLYWEKDGRILEIEETDRVFIEQIGQVLKLIIKNTSIADQAVYSCVGTNRFESAAAHSEGRFVEIPSVLIRNTSDMVRAGAEVLLKCEAHGIPRPKTRWLWQGSDVESLHNFEVLEEGSLLIHNVHPENAGQLDCVAHNSVGEVKDSVTLSVGYPPSISDALTVLQLEIEGSGVLLCNGTGIPKPDSHWERQDGKAFDPSRVKHDIITGALLFSDAQLSDEGIYYCSLENKFGHVSLEREVVITGLVSPIIEERKEHLKNYLSNSGVQLEFPCHVSAGKPSPSVSWFKDGFQINPTAGLDGLSIEANNSLIISKTNLKHEGSYKCEAVNIAGSANLIYQLQITDPPVIENSEYLNLTEKSGNNALLPCLAHGTPQPEIQWLRSDSSPIALTERILRTYEGLVIIEVQPKDAGKYTCVAINPAGSANRTLDLAVQDPPRILGETFTEIVANMGDVLSLPCNATGVPTPEYLWSHNHQDVSYSDHILPSTNSDGLVITSVVIDDSGEYHCSAVNDAGSANKTITLTVQEPPAIDPSDPSQVVVLSGQSAKLMCRATGIPPPRFAWTLKGQPVVQENAIQSESNEQSLVLPHVLESDSGSYICTAYNLAGSDARAVKLVVQVKPSIEPWQDNIKVLEGQELILDCLMYGIPAPNGTWLKDGVTILPTNSSDYLVQYKISAELSHSGRYECQANNEVGSTARAVNVEVLASPRTLEPAYNYVETATGNKIKLNCVDQDTQGYPPPTIKWSLNGSPVNLSSTLLNFDSFGTLYIGEISPLHAGIYSCLAVNEAGNSSRTFNISVLEQPRIQENFNKNKTLMEGEDFSLPCSASGIPTPSVSWTFKNHTLSSREDYDDLILMDDKTLVIVSARANSSGVYTCIAKNKMGEDRQQLNIEVYVPPTMTKDDVIHSEVKEGENVNLKCPSSNSAEIEWRQNGDPIDFTANERSDEAHFKLLDGGRTLAIFESRPTDNGTYTCTASNPVGHKDAKFYLEVLWAPFFEEFGASQKEYTVVEGNSVSFDCLSSGSPTPKVIWKINDSLPVTEHTAPGVVVLPSSRHMLTIPRVRAHHSGIYKCQAINRVGHSNKQFLLHVIVPPYIEIDSEDHHEVLRGDTVSLVCPVLGSPKPTYSWDYSNISNQLDWDSGKIELQNNSQIIVIPNIDFSDGGVYVCNGSNQAGFKLKRFNLSVMGLQNFTSSSEAPTIEDGDTEEEFNALEGGTLSLDCTAHGQPLPDIQWTHNGHTLPSDNTRERFDLDTSSVTQTLTIYSSGTVNAGRYECHATNNLGAAEKVYRIRYQVAPRIEGKATSFAQTVTSVHGLPFNMHCPAAGEPTPLISWMKDGTLLKSDVDYVIDGSQGETLHFKHSFDHHSGNYTCVATNSAGSVSKSYLLDVLVPPYHPNNVEVVTEDVLRFGSLNLQCDFKGHPIPKLMWIKGIEPISEPHTSRGLHLADDNHTLIIPSVELHHAGRYSCLGNNEAGSAELMFHIRVSDAPQRNEAVTRNFSVVTVRPLRRFMILCAMNGSPTPNITWFKDDSLLDNGSLDGSIQISSDGRQLHILRSFENHVGLYRCHAENAVGSTDAFFQVLMEGDWAEWSDWSACSVSCGHGVQSRKRECFTSDCIGERSDSRPCFMSDCPVNGGWSDWSEWTSCNEQCGQHKKRRSRICNNPEPAYGGLPCLGNDHETEDCALPPCPIDGGWSDWSEWSKCSVTCSNGIQMRHRSCNSPEPVYGGQFCDGYDTETSSCNEKPCSGEWSAWSDWTPCSASCGSGVRQRYRKCLSSGCEGFNKEYEYCKLRRCFGDGPRKAYLNLHGNLNGYNLRNDSLYAYISGDERTKRGHIITKLHNIHKREAPIQPIVPLLVSPVSWSVAYEDREARNGYSLTNGFFNQDSKVQFATGQEMRMKHVGRGLDSTGQLKIDIEVIGEVPYSQPLATIIVQPFTEDFIQTGANTLYVSSVGTLSADGRSIPYSLNSTLSYDQGNGAMPYLSEKMSTDPIETSYDSDLQEMRYTLSTVISQRFDDNKCPQGFKLNVDHQHCEDVDECSDSSTNKCHSTQLCENLLGSYRCSCPSGFRALNLGSRCLDVNECLQEPPLCSHDCRNVPGSFHCICPPGTYLLEDRHTCSASPYWDDPDETYGVTSDSQDEVPSGGDDEDGSINEELTESGNFPQEFRLADEEWSCPKGLVRSDGLCGDFDECFEDPDICGEDEICLNMYKTYLCIHTPCGEKYRRDPVSRECVALCSKDSPCSSGAQVAEKILSVAVSLSPDSNQPGLDLMHLSVSDDHVEPYKIFPHTKYYITSNHKGKMFHLRQNSYNSVLYSSRKLKPGKVYRVGVRGDTSSDDAKTIIYSTKFIIYVHVLDGESLD